MEKANQPNKAIVISIIIVLLIAATAGVVILSKKETTNQVAQDTTQTNQVATSGSGTNSASSATYKDGSYTATGTYRTPGGQESIEVKLTLQNNTITEANVEQNASGGEAEEYQSAFVSGYKSQVVGKKIQDVSLSRVAGSSLTPIGFNSALENIKKEASV